MTRDEKLKLIRDFVIQNLTFYDAPVNEVKVKMFAAELVDLDLQSISVAFATFRQEKGRRMMPMPADIRDRVKPLAVSDDALAIEAVARIVQGLSKFGGYRGEEAKTFVGELGWEVVKRQGGWTELCSSVGVDNPIGVFQSQAVKIAKAVLEQSRAGTLGDAPELPQHRIAADPTAKMVSMQELLAHVKEKQP